MERRFTESGMGENIHIHVSSALRTNEFVTCSLVIVITVFKNANATRSHKGGHTRETVWVISGAQTLPKMPAYLSSFLSDGRHTTPLLLRRGLVQTVTNSHRMLFHSNTFYIPTFLFAPKHHWSKFTRGL